MSKGSSTSTPNIANMAARSYRLPEHLAATYGVDSGYAKFLPADGGGRRAGTTATTPPRGWGPFSNPEGILRRHVDHCLEILRQAVMCQPDTGVFGQYWVAATNASGSWSGEDLGERPFVDFHTTHRCKNFEELRDWVVEHQISANLKRAAKLERRPGDRVLPGIP
ncbi:tat pathway signal sequence [Apiospora saccharicola]